MSLCRSVDLEAGWLTTWGVVGTAGSTAPYPTDASDDRDFHFGGVPVHRCGVLAIRGPKGQPPEDHGPSRTPRRILVVDTVSVEESTLGAADWPPIAAVLSSLANLPAMADGEGRPEKQRYRSIIDPIRGQPPHIVECSLQQSRVHPLHYREEGRKLGMLEAAVGAAAQSRPGIRTSRSGRAWCKARITPAAMLH